MFKTPENPNGVYQQIPQSISGTLFEPTTIESETEPLTADQYVTFAYTDAPMTLSEERGKKNKNKGNSYQSGNTQKPTTKPKTTTRKYFSTNGLMVRKFFARNFWLENRYHWLSCQFQAL